MPRWRAPARAAWRLAGEAREDAMRVAVLGATGLVGDHMVECLAAMGWVTEPPLLLASSRSAGKRLAFRDRTVACGDAATCDWRGVDVALFSAGAAASRRYAPLASGAGAWVVDNSSAYRMEPDVPLIVPEINPALLPAAGRSGRGGIIANPNCSTIQIALALAPLREAFGLREVHVTTLQSVSGAGQRGIAELAAAEVARREGRAFAPAVFARPIAADVVPQIGPFLDDGSCEEEAKVDRELRKILDQPDLTVTCTVTRVPVVRGHGAAVRVVLASPATPAEAAARLSSWPGLAVGAEPGEYRTPAAMTGRRDVHVGRLRGQADHPDVLLFWVVADNVLKGAAWNAVQIADLLARSWTSS
jgi:aspartate-semialdehyde dehydrogenase